VTDGRAGGSRVRTVFLGSGAFGIPALRRLAEHPDVELVGVVDPEDLVGEIGSALGVRDSVSGRRVLTAEERRDVRTRIAQQLDQASTLLVLDNCEHLIGAVADLVAFLGTLTSEQAPGLPDKIAPVASGPAVPAEQVSTVSQDDKTFHPGHVAIPRGGRLWIVNNDTRTHNVRIFDPALDFDSGAQEPGETVEIDFPATGSFLVFCGIHPKMELYVDVAPK